MGLRYPSARWTRQPEERGVLCGCRVQLAIVPYPAGRLGRGCGEGGWGERVRARLTGTRRRRDGAPGARRRRGTPLADGTASAARRSPPSGTPEPAFDRHPRDAGVRRRGRVSSPRPPLPRPPGCGTACRSRRTRSGPGPGPTGRPGRCVRSRRPPSRGHRRRRNRAGRRGRGRCGPCPTRSRRSGPSGRAAGARWSGGSGASPRA